MVRDGRAARTPRSLHRILRTRGTPQAETHCVWSTLPVGVLSVEAADLQPAYRIRPPEGRSTAPSYVVRSFRNALWWPVTVDDVAMTPAAFRARAAKGDMEIVEMLGAETFRNVYESRDSFSAEFPCAKIVADPSMSEEIRPLQSSHHCGLLTARFDFGRLQLASVRQVCAIQTAPEGPTGACDRNKTRTPTMGKKLSLRAVGAPFSFRETLKLRKYRWDAGDRRRRGAWYLDVPEDNFDAECEFLREEIYRRKDADIESRLLTAYERYSDREDSA
jgi:hypothetical protein